MVEAVEPFKMHHTSMSYLYEVFEHLQLLWMGIWLHIQNITTADVSPDLGELAEMQECKPYHYAMVEAVEPFKLHITSMSYLYEVFEHLQLLWMGIWMHTHTVTTTDVSPDLGELAEILGDARVQTIPLRYG
jgi:hypothetical protein